MEVHVHWGQAACRVESYSQQPAALPLDTLTQQWEDYRNKWTRNAGLTLNTASRPFYGW